MNHALRFILLIASAVTMTGCVSVNVTFGEDETVESLRAAYLESDTREGILFWDTEERRVGFKRAADIYPARRVAASDTPLPLPSAPADLSDITYSVDGQPYSLDDFTDMPGNIGLIVIRDGDVLFERYQRGNDEDSVWISFSVTKSITSMLIGAAIQDGYIKSVDEPVANYLPRLRGTGYERATIRDVLQMSSGIAWNEDYADPESDVAKAGGANGIALVQYLAGLDFDHPPGTVFNYNTGETNLVGEILRSAIGNNASTYLQKKIWQPYGMANDAWWLLGDEDGAELGGCCLNMTLRDYARVGLFALADGVLPDGTRVLPAGWMEASTSPSAGEAGYGYLWWLFGEGSYAALGIFGQTIFIDPASNSVIAIHSSADQASGSEYHDHRDAVLFALRERLRTR